MCLLNNRFFNPFSLLLIPSFQDILRPFQDKVFSILNLKYKDQD